MLILSITIITTAAVRWYSRLHNGESELRQKYMDSVEYYKSRSGKVVAQTYEKLKIQVSLEEKKEIDSLRRELSLKDRQLQGYLKIVSSTDYSKATGKIDTIIRKDSISLPIYKYSYSDPYLKYKATAYPDSLKFLLFETIDSVYVMYSTTKIGKTEYTRAHIMHSNPNTTTLGATSISYRVPREYRRLSLGMHVGMNVFSKNPVISVGLNYDVLRLKKKIK